MDQTIERWRPVPGWEGFYEVSDHGRVRSLDRVVANGTGMARKRGRIMRTFICRSGYPSVKLAQQERREGPMVHRLVLDAFVGPCPPGHETRHLNGRPTDNALANLAWGLPTENAADRRAHGTHREGERLPQSRFTDATALQALRMHATGATYGQVAEAFGVRPTTVAALVIRRTWKHLCWPE